MADDKKTKVPDHIEKFHKNYDKAKRLIDTADHHHRQAYEHAVAKHLYNKEGEVDYDILKEAKTQQAFADTMADFYVDKAFSYFGLKKEHEPLTKAIKNDVFKKDLLMKAYANTTQSELRGLTSQYKQNFKYDKFAEAKESFMEKTRGELLNAAVSHLNKDHIDDIIKYTGVGDKVNKDAVTLQGAVKLLQYHKDAGSAPAKPELLEGLVGEYALKPELRSGYKKPEKKK